MLANWDVLAFVDLKVIHSFFHTTEQLQLVLRNDHLNKTGHNSKTN